MKKQKTKHVLFYHFCPQLVMLMRPSWKWEFEVSPNQNPDCRCSIIPRGASVVYSWMFLIQHEHSIPGVCFARSVDKYFNGGTLHLLNALKLVLWFNDQNVIYSIYQHFQALCQQRWSRMCKLQWALCLYGRGQRRS